MLDIGWSEFLVIGVVALVVIGPRELPGALRTAGRYAARARALAQDFRDGLDDIARETELKDLNKKILDDTDDWMNADEYKENFQRSQSEDDVTQKIERKDDAEPTAEEDDPADMAEADLDEADADDAREEQAASSEATTAKKPDSDKA